MNSGLDQLIQDGVIDASAKPLLKKFVALFEAYNQHTNLSAIRETEAIWLKHIVDSLMVLKFEPCDGRVLDLGTGGGLPGIPLAIARPEAQVTLLDSVAKKIRACQHFMTELGLENVETVHTRAEQLVNDPIHAKGYDMVLARATAYLPTILDWSAPLLKPDGRIVLYKTSSETELLDGSKAARRLGLSLTNQHAYELDGQARQLLVYKQTKNK